MPNKLRDYCLIPIEVHIVALVLAIILIFASLYVSVTVNSKEELKEVHLGLPLRYVIQNQSRYDPPFPFQMRFYSILEDPTQIYFPNLILNVFLVFLVVDGVLILLTKVVAKKRKTDY